MGTEDAHDRKEILRTPRMATGEMKRNSGESLENLTYKKIKDLLIDYRLAPGQRLVYQDLANMFSVSRTPVKNALSRLEQEGFVTLIPEKGYMVKEICRKEASELLAVLEMLELHSVREIVRKHLSVVTLREIKKILGAYAKAVKKELDRERFIIDARLHTKIVELTGNTFLASLVKEIFEKIYLQIRISGLSQKRGNVAKDEHEKIYRAIQEGNVREATKWVTLHAKNRKNNILSNAFKDHQTKNFKSFLFT